MDCHGSVGLDEGEGSIEGEARDDMVNDVSVQWARYYKPENIVIKASNR